MRKIIVGLFLLLLAVLCFSNLSRITDAAFDKFFADDSTVNSGSGSSNNESDGSSSGDNSSDDGTDVYVSFKKSVQFDGNYIVDTSSYVQEGGYYYYKILDDDSYAKCSEILNSEKMCFVSSNSYSYILSSTPVPEDDSCTVIFNYDSIISRDSGCSFVRLPDNLEESSFSPLKCFSVEGFDYYFSYVKLNGVIKIVVTDEPLSALNSYRIYKYSKIYGLKDDAIDDIVYLSDVEYVGILT